MEYFNITLTRNKCFVKLIKSINKKEVYPLCIFHFMALNNATVSPEHYSVNIIDNFYTKYNHMQRKCLYRIAQNFGGRKLWRNWNCKKIGGENFGCWQRQIHLILELMRPHNVLADKTLADWQ